MTLLDTRNSAAAPHPAAQNAWEEECREVVESVLGELRKPALDPDCRAACCDLLQHLSVRR